MKINFSDWSALESYLLLDLKLSEKSSSVSALKSRYKVLCSYYTKLDEEFNRHTFSAFLGSMRDGGYAVSYLNSFITLAKYLDKYFSLNELKDYTYFPDRKTVLYEILTAGEMEKMAEVVLPYQKMADIINQRQKALIYLLATTGCRISEALALKRTDIYNTPPHVMYCDTKNNTDRAVPIPDFLHKMLVELSSDTTEVFKSGRGGKLDPQQINLDLKRRAEACGIKKHVWAHLFRHSFITHMLEAGAEISDVGVMVGHQDPKSTMRYKNSQLEHYAEVMMLHPLLRKKVTLEMIQKRLVDMIDKLVDKEMYTVALKEDSNSFAVVIENNEH